MDIINRSAIFFKIMRVMLYIELCRFKGHKIKKIKVNWFTYSCTAGLGKYWRSSYILGRFLKEKKKKNV